MKFRTTCWSCFGSPSIGGIPLRDMFDDIDVTEIGKFFRSGSGPGIRFSQDLFFSTCGNILLGKNPAGCVQCRDSVRFPRTITFRSAWNSLSWGSSSIMSSAYARIPVSGLLIFMGHTGCQFADCRQFLLIAQAGPEVLFRREMSPRDRTCADDFHPCDPAREKRTVL